MTPSSARATPRLARSGALALLAAKAAATRLRHDLGRELTVLVATAVLTATFLYVFNDFLNVQIAGLAPAMRDAFARVVAVVVILLAADLAARALAAELTAAFGLKRSAERLGEDAGTLRWYLALRTLAVVTVVIGVASLAVRRYLLRTEAAGTALVAVVALVVTAIDTGLRWRAGRRRKDDASAAGAAGEAWQPTSRMRTIVAWRMAQMLGRNRAARAALAAAGASSLLVLLAAARGAPPFAAGAAALALGFVASFALMFQAADDLAHAWAERGLGVTHEEFTGAYERIGLLVGLVAAALAALAYILGATFAGTLATYGLGAALKTGVLAAVPLFVTPWLLLQIDGRRPAVTGLVVFITALFVGTAILAHAASLVLLPLLRHFARGSQAGRYYRA